VKYMLLTYLDEKAWLALSPDEQRREMGRCEPHVAKLLENKKLLAGAPLHPTTTATTVRLQGEKRLLTDGPFAETREQLGGYSLIDADNLDDAIAIATGFLSAKSKIQCIIEVRAIVDFDDNVPMIPDDRA
jgi:hypothetical protein